MDWIVQQLGSKRFEPWLIPTISCKLHRFCRYDPPDEPKDGFFNSFQVFQVSEHVGRVQVKHRVAIRTVRQEYIHRVGRTARGASGKGKALLFLMPEAGFFLRTKWAWHRGRQIQFSIFLSSSARCFLNDFYLPWCGYVVGYSQWLRLFRLSQSGNYFRSSQGLATPMRNFKYL